MKRLQNLHTHTTYCDGVNTPEQIIAAALEKGFDSIGFSGHSYMFYSTAIPMSPEGTQEYKKEILALKDKYKGQLGVYLGLEFDMYSQIDLEGYEYTLGSAHYLKIGDEYIAFDRSAEAVKNVIHTYFGGSGMAFAKEYYRQLAMLPDYGSFDIIGHFDIITKNIEKAALFDMESKEYMDAALTALDALRGKIPFFEVNTGAMARGYRTSPYPTASLLKHIKDMGFGAIISSDCHDARYLDFGFDTARELLLSCGFQEQYILTDTGFSATAL